MNRHETIVPRAGRAAIVGVAMLAAAIAVASGCVHEVIENGPPPYASITHGDPVPTPTPVPH